MPRPDPNRVQKQPMARAERGSGRIGISPPAATTARAAGPLFDADGRLDLDAVCELVDAAEVMVEGKVYEAVAVAGGAGSGAVFMGTALITLQPGTLPLSSVHALRDALSRDTRGLEALKHRAWREVARLLGPETPETLEMTATLSVSGLEIQADFDLEGPVERATAV